MSNFDAIRPYHDHEVPTVVARLVANVELRDGIATFLFPQLYARAPGIARAVTGLLLRWRARELRSVHDVQMMMRRYIDVMIRSSVVELSSSGIEHVPNEPCLFVSNHRDIVLDTVFLNRVLHAHGLATCRMAVGDNLLTSDIAADIMRLNKSFVVERGATGARAIYRALSQTSSYIRYSLDEGESVWIAQREGRAKDGLDRTEPALLKMFGLAYKKQIDSLGEWLEQVNLIPVGITYELDPCDLAKAEEVFITATQGHYDKPSGADLEQMIASVTGNKGRVHIGFGPRILGRYDSAEALAGCLDASITGAFRVYPTHVHAARQLGVDDASAEVAEHTPTLDTFKQRVAQCDAQQRIHLLQQYANVVENKRHHGSAAVQADDVDNVVALKGANSP